MYRCPSHARQADGVHSCLFVAFRLGGEIRHAEWVKFDPDDENPAYTVPPSIRKLRKAEKENPNTQPHIVPLSRQAVAILRELHQRHRTWTLSVPRRAKTTTTEKGTAPRENRESSVCS